MRFYSEWALRIARGHLTDGNAFYGLPGYPFLVAAIYKIFSVGPIFVTELQAATDSFVAYLTYKIAELIFKMPKNASFSTSIGVMSALGYVFFVPAQAFSIVLMPTSLLVLAFWSVTWWCLRHRERDVGRLEALLVGLGVGIMAMIVATIFFVLPLTFFAILRRKTLRYQNSLLLIVGVVCGCSPAFLHNRLIAHDTVFLSAHGGLNFFIGNNSESTGYLKIPSGLRANQSEMLADSISVAERALNAGGRIPRSAVSAYWSDRAKTYIRENPGAWIKLLGQKFCNFWNAYQYDDLSIVRSFSKAGITTPGIYYGIVSALGLAGICLSVGSSFTQSRWVTGAIFLHVASILTVFVTERYRLAAVPGLSIMGAFFVVQSWENLSAFSWFRASQSAITLCLTTLFVTIQVPNQGAWALDSYNSGIRFLEAKDLTAAEKELQIAWRYAPDNSNTNFALGNLYLAKNDYQGAKAFYRRTLQLEPRNTGALNNLGHIALLQRMPDAAIHFFSQTIAIQPANVLAYYQLARSYLEDGRPGEALEAIHRAIDIRPDYPPFQELQKNIQSKLLSR